MKKLLLVAVVAMSFGLMTVGCGANPSSGSGTVVQETVVATPEGTSVKSGACHYQSFAVGADPIYYEDANICVARYESGVYQVTIPFVMTLGQYQAQKTIAEQMIDERIGDQKCQFHWAPAEEVEGLATADLLTKGCPEPPNTFGS